mmetsp:Transcript_22638/g.49118  ORF Transcript_22638/g.49118 Transcript_22638/m.49118 type:complete len:115 (+) Transcript_22638:853-1197(+)
MEGSATQIILGMVICFVAIFVFHETAPFADVWDDRLNLVAQWQLLVMESPSFEKAVQLLGGGSHQTMVHTKLKNTLPAQLSCKGSNGAPASCFFNSRVDLKFPNPSFLHTDVSH